MTSLPGIRAPHARPKVMTGFTEYETIGKSRGTGDGRDCDRCGRNRPANPRRYTVTASDFTDATADFERAHLCAPCWRHFRDEIRRCFA